MTRHADYYQRVKQDPEKLAALRARRARNQRERRSRISPCSQQDTELLTTEPVKDALTFFDEPVVSTPVVSKPEADPVVTDLDFEERAAIMEFDGGLSRAEAEFEAALRSTVPLVTEPFPATQPPETREKPGCVTVAPVASLGGKHAATVPPGDLTLTPEQIMEAWRGVWNQ